MDAALSHPAPVGRVHRAERDRVVLNMSAISTEPNTGKPIVTINDMCDQCQRRARVAQLAAPAASGRSAPGRWFYVCAECCSRVLDLLGESE
jgi:hypothetical protein